MSTSLQPPAGRRSGRLGWLFEPLPLHRVAVMRVVAELAPDTLAWQVAAALGWLLAFAPWVAHIGRIYLSPRVDGGPG